MFFQYLLEDPVL